MTEKFKIAAKPYIALNQPKVLQNSETLDYVELNGLKIVFDQNSKYLNGHDYVVNIFFL
jgi:hypothetical protein